MYKETCPICIVTYYIKWFKTSWTLCTTAAASVSSCPERATNYATGSKLFVTELFNDDYTFMHPDNTVVVQVRTSRNAVDDEVAEEGAEEGAEAAAEATTEAAAE